MPNSVQKIRNLFEAVNQPLTLNDIKRQIPDLASSEISMAMCYLRRQRYVYKTLIDNKNQGRKRIFLFHYSKDKLSEDFYE